MCRRDATPPTGLHLSMSEGTTWRVIKTPRGFFKSWTDQIVSPSACCVNNAASDVQFELNDLQSDAGRAIWAGSRLTSYSSLFGFQQKVLLFGPNWCEQTLSGKLRQRSVLSGDHPSAVRRLSISNVQYVTGVFHLVCSSCVDRNVMQLRVRMDSWVTDNRKAQ